MEYTIEHFRSAAGRNFEIKKGEEIVGYGSTISATTPVYSLELGQYLKAFIDDDTYSKILRAQGLRDQTLTRPKAFLRPVTPITMLS